jgi:hypothetical protein
MVPCPSARPFPLNKFGADKSIYRNLVFGTISVKNAFRASSHGGLQLILNTFKFLVHPHFLRDKKRGSWDHDSVRVYLFQLLKQ